MWTRRRPSLLIVRMQLPVERRDPKKPQEAIEGARGLFIRYKCYIVVPKRLGTFSIRYKGVPCNAQKMLQVFP